MCLPAASRETDAERVPDEHRTNEQVTELARAPPGREPEESEQEWRGQRTSVHGRDGAEVAEASGERWVRSAARRELGHRGADPRCEQGDGPERGVDLDEPQHGRLD
jgi:hypothetical protein